MRMAKRRKLFERRSVPNIVGHWRSNRQIRSVPIRTADQLFGECIRGAQREAPGESLRDLRLKRVVPGITEWRSEERRDRAPLRDWSQRLNERLTCRESRIYAV